MTLDRRRDPPGLTRPAHPDDDHVGGPEHWGWHHEWGRAARVAGWIVAGLLLAMHTTVQYGPAGRAWLTTLAAAVVAALMWDVHRRKNAWRNPAGDG